MSSKLMKKSKKQQQKSPPMMSLPLALPAPSVRKRAWHTYWKYAFWILPLSIILASYLLIFKDLPSPTSLGRYDIPLATKIYDRNGVLLFDIFADENRTAVPLVEIPL